MDPFGTLGIAGMVGLVFSMIVLAIFLIIVVLIVMGLVKKSREESRNDMFPEVSAAAAIVAKRIETSGGGESVVRQRHFVTFQQPSGERFELEVPAGDFGMMVEGDRGTVGMKGTRFLGFAREIAR